MAQTARPVRLWPLGSHDQHQTVRGIEGGTRGHGFGVVEHWPLAWPALGLRGSLVRLPDRAARVGAAELQNSPAGFPVAFGTKRERHLVGETPKAPDA